MNQKDLTLALLVLVSAALVVAPLSIVSGQSVTGFSIIQVTQQNGYTSITSANVGDAITVIATLAALDSPYQIWFGEVPVTNGVSEGYYIAANFTVPELPGGAYDITLGDVQYQENTTYAFQLNTLYSVNPILPQSPKILQEGDNVVLNVSVTGGVASSSYVANLTLSLPASLPTSTGNFSRMVSFSSSDKGTGMTQVTFPEAAWQPSGSTTIYTGTYSVVFNSSAIASSSFVVGITDASDYHRGETVSIRGISYQPGQSATVSVQQVNGTSTIFSQQATADSNGVITASWQIPSSAPLAQYNVSIVPTGTGKAIPDTQLISLPGYRADFTALNLASEVVPGLVVEALDQQTSQLYNGTTSEFGVASINLEIGNYAATAYWNDVNVGQIQLSVSGNTTANIPCQLANLRITVKDKTGILIPSTNLDISYQYTTTKNPTTKSGSVQGQTDITGVYTYSSTLPNIAYTVDASKYGVVFNSGNNSVSSLPAQATFDVFIICPDEQLTLTTVDYGSAAISNARLVLFEQTSGIFYSATTSGAGAASLQVTFGQYKVSVYSADNVLLNETVVNVLAGTNSQIHCVLYNLDISVQVVDFFGNPISNANVELSRTGVATKSGTTSGSGTVTFDNAIGGNVNIVAYPSGNQASFVAANVDVESPTTIKVQMAKYASVAGLLVDVNVLAVIIIVVAAVLFFVVIEVAKLKGFRLRRKAENKDM